MKKMLVCQDNRKSRKVVFISIIYIFRKCLTNAGLGNNITPLFYNVSAMSAFLIFRVNCETQILKVKRVKICKS